MYWHGLLHVIWHTGPGATCSTTPFRSNTAQIKSENIEIYPLLELRHTVLGLKSLDMTRQNVFSGHFPPEIATIQEYLMV
jgi:hypothetical protein